MRYGKRNLLAAALMAAVMTCPGAAYAESGSFHVPEPLGDSATNFVGGSYARQRLEKEAEENGEAPEQPDQAETQMDQPQTTQTDQPQTTQTDQPQTAAQTDQPQTVAQTDQPQTAGQTDQPQSTTPDTQSAAPFAIAQSETNSAFGTQGQGGGQAQTSDQTTAIHSYMLVKDNITWQQAFQNAEAVGGYLAHIDSQEEFDYIVKQIQDDGIDAKVFLIGGRRNLNEYNYYWANMDGTPDKSGMVINDPGYWIAQNNKWLRVNGTTEPTYTDSGTGEAEDCLELLHYKGSNTAGDSGAGWYLNDVSQDVRQYNGDEMGYIVEIEN